MASLAGRDLGALASLYDRYGRLAYSLAYRILGESEAAEDVVQDAFLSAWRGAASYRRERGNPRAWLLSIVHHRAVDLLRRKTTFRPAPLEAAELSPADDDTAELAEKNVEHKTVRDAPAGARPAAAWRIRFGRVRAWPIAMAGLASVAVLLAVIDIDASRRLAQATAERDKWAAVADSVSEGGRWWYMAGKDELDGAGGTLIVPRAEGHGPFVLFHDLPKLSGKLLTVWLVSSDNTWVRAATFRPNGQGLQAVDVTVPVAGFDRCAVTLETAWTGPHTGTVVMESRIAPPPAN